jgi:hypothetical protein
VRNHFHFGSCFSLRISNGQSQFQTHHPNHLKCYASLFHASIKLRRLSVYSSVVLLLLLLVVCVDSTSRPVRAQDNWHITDLKLNVVFSQNGSAFVTENVTFDSQGSVSKILIPLFALRDSLPNAPFWFFSTSLVAVNVRNIRATILTQFEKHAEDLGGGLVQEVQVNLRQATNNGRISLEYELEQAYFSYWGITSYDVILSPSVPVNHAELQIVIAGLDPPSPSWYYLISNGYLGNEITYFLDQTETANGNVASSFEMGNLTPSDYPLRITTQFSTIPGLGLVGYWGPSIILTGSILVAGMELLYLFAGAVLKPISTAESPRRRSLKLTLKGIRLPGTLNPTLLAMTAAVWYVYLVPFDLMSGRLNWVISWTTPFFLLSACYWLLHIQLWPALAFFDYALAGRISPVSWMTASKLETWIRRDYTSLAIFLAFMSAGFNLMWILFYRADIWATPDRMLLWKSDPFLIVAILAVCVLLLGFLWRLSRISRVETEIFKQLDASYAIEETKVLETLRSKSVNDRLSRAGLESLSKAGLISLDHGTWFVIRRPRERIRLSDPDAERAFALDLNRVSERLQTIGPKLGIDPETVSFPRDLRECERRFGM